jgi:hypothetical protein
MGDDHPLPGMGVFHFTFSLSLQRIGTSLASEMPLPAGPRNCGHSPALAETHHAATISKLLQ